jgi:hypothetical protein
MCVGHTAIVVHRRIADSRAPTQQIDRCSARRAGAWLCPPRIVADALRHSLTEELRVCLVLSLSHTIFSNVASCPARLLSPSQSPNRQLQRPSARSVSSLPLKTAFLQRFVCI